MKKKRAFGKAALLATMVASSVGVLGAADNLSAAGTQSAAPAAQTSVVATPSARSAAGVHYTPNLSRRAQMYYQGVWGVDDLKVKYTESGEIIRFSWRVLDPAKATPLNKKETEPYLLDSTAGVKLVVPQLEKIGALRQSSSAIADKSYWMLSTNHNSFRNRVLKPAAEKAALRTSIYSPCGELALGTLEKTRVLRSPRRRCAFPSPSFRVEQI